MNGEEIDGEETELKEAVCVSLCWKIPLNIKVM